MQVFVTKKDKDTLEISSDKLDKISLACLEIGGAVHLSLKIDVAELEIGKPMLVDTTAVKPKL